MNAYRTDVDPLAALGDATRRGIVETLREGERTVGDLAAGLPVSRPAVSQHLAVLKAAGLVVERAQGTRHYYRLDPIGLVRLHDRIDAMWGIDAGMVPTPPLGVPAGAAPATSEAAEPPVEDTSAKGRRKKRKKKGGRKRDRS